MIFLYFDNQSIVAYNFLQLEEIMNYQKNKCNLIYIFIFLCIAAVGINDSMGLSRGEFHPPIFYTTLSGLLCFIYFMLGFVKGIVYQIQGKDEENFFVLPRFKGSVTIAITVTLLVYHFLVYEGPILSVDTDIYNIIKHYIVPIMVIAHYFLFDNKGIYKVIDPIIWLVFPTCYFTWVNIKAATVTGPYWDGKYYPYGFIDLTLHSVSEVAVTVVILFAFFTILGFGLYAIDRKLAVKNHIYSYSNEMSKSL